MYLCGDFQNNMQLILVQTLLNYSQPHFEVC